MYNILGNVIYYSVGFLIFLILLAIVASYEKLRYYIKLSVYTAALIIPASLHCPFMFLRIGDWRNALLTGSIVKTVQKSLGVTYHIRGKENILRDSGSVVLLNHQSILDTTDSKSIPLFCDRFCLQPVCQEGENESQNTCRTIFPYAIYSTTMEIILIPILPCSRSSMGGTVLLMFGICFLLLVVLTLSSVLERGIAVVKKEILYYGLFGLATWLCGFIFVDRGNNSEAREKINTTAKRVKDLKMNVIVFPEGRRHSNSTLLPFKKGAFHLAIDSQLPILPVTISKYYFLNSKRKIFNSGTSYITILPPISTEGLTKEDLPKLIEDTYRIMNKSFVETSQEAINQHINSFEDGK